MKKSDLKGFINKYSLPKSSNSFEKVKWTFGEDSISTKITDVPREIIGTITWKNVGNIHNGDIGIMRTKQLSRIVDAMDDELRFNVGSKSINMQDDHSHSEFIIANEALISEVNPPTKDKLPPFEISIDISSDFIRKFEKSLGAFDGVDKIAFVRESDAVDRLIINYDSEIDVSNIKLDLDVTREYEGKYKLIFSADWFKNMLIENKDCGITVDLSLAGILNFNAKNDNFESELFLQSLETGDSE